MRSFIELPAYLNTGVDTYNPPLTGTDFKFCRLKNLQPRRNRLATLNGLSLSSSIGATGGILAIGYYTEPTNLFSTIYAFSPTSVYSYDFAIPGFSSTPIYSGFANDTERYVLIPWYDKVFATKLGNTTCSLSGGTVTPYPTLPAGRYGVCANSHMMFANISTPGGKYPSRIQWSDLYNPTNFTIDTDSEADYFDLEESDGECTGLSYQRGNVLAYSREQVWLGTYASGKFTFQPLYNGIGNVYHYANVRVKEIDFFISEDGIYLIDGLQLKSVGDPIWKFFEDDVVNDLNSPVVGAVDSKNYEVFWTYTNKLGAKWQIVYNYKEDKWSDRDPQNELCRCRFKKPIRGFMTIDSFSTMIDGGVDSARIIDGSWQFYQFSGKEFIGVSDGNVYSIDETKYVKADNSSIVSEFETFDMFFDKADHVKEINKKLLQFAKTNTVNMKLAVAVREYLSEDLVWSAYRDVDTTVSDSTSFFIHDLGVGKFIRFKVQITNSTVGCVKELFLASLFVQRVEQNDGVEEQ